MLGPLQGFQQLLEPEGGMSHGVQEMRAHTGCHPRMVGVGVEGHHQEGSRSCQQVVQEMWSRLVGRFFLILWIG